MYSQLKFNIRYQIANKKSNFAVYLKKLAMKSAYFWDKLSYVFNLLPETKNAISLPH
jgi:hypothetical protein